MPSVTRCSWWAGYGHRHRSCQNRATHEWTITGISSGWNPRCDDHRVVPSVPGEMMTGAKRLVRELPRV